MLKHIYQFDSSWIVVPNFIGSCSDIWVSQACSETSWLLTYVVFLLVAIFFCNFVLGRRVQNKKMRLLHLKLLSLAWQGDSYSSFMISDFYRTQVYLGSDLWVRVSLTERPFWDLTDVTLADEDTNSIPTDNANRTIKVMWQFKWRNLVAKFVNHGLMARFGSNASGATWWPCNVEPIQVVPSVGQICN